VTNNHDTEDQHPVSSDQYRASSNQHPVPALVLTGYGLNCDNETAYALKLAGADPQRVHINALVDSSVRLEDYKMLIFGGGFSWGDDHGAGVVQAIRMKYKIGDRILEFVERGNLVMGICNGFQTLVNLGLLPGLKSDYRTRSVAVTYNDCGNFRDQWVHLRVNPKSPCIFTRGLEHLELPVRHGEGKFYTDTDTLNRLIQDQQVSLQYALLDGKPADGAFPENPNGSLFDIAGLCDPSGRIFGLMPHPEAFNHSTNHPDWTNIREEWLRTGEAIDSGLTPGIQMFQNAVDFLFAE